MAIANSDGSIILSTKVDTSGINKGMSQMQGKATGLTKTFSKLGAAIASAFAIQKIIQFSNEAGQLATQTEASVQRLVDIYGSASESVGNFIDQNSKALGLSKSVGASIASTYGNLLSVWADQATNAELTNALLNQTAVVASKTGRTTTDVAERIRSGLLGNTEAIEDLGINVNIKTIEITDAFKRIADGRSWEQLNAYEQAQVRTLAILEQSTNKYGTTVADTSATVRNRFNAAYQDFQNSWGNIVNTVLLPVLETLTQIFDIATKGLNVLSGRSGKILENVETQEENSDKTAENIEEQVENQKDLNKEMKKTLAGFDDIQILSAGTAETTQPPPDVNNIIGGDGTAPDGSAYEQEISSTLTAIMGVVGTALAALGCILLFTGHIGWGLGFLIAGAATLGVTVATLGDDTIAQETKDALSNALIITGGVAILIGILLCMASQWGIGIGLIVIGVSSIVAPIALNWDGIKEQLQGSFGGWLVLGGVIAIVLGILLCFTPMLPLGIGLIVLGVGAVVAPIVANWDAIKNTITTTFSKIINWIETHGLAMLVLGCILCATGVAFPIGLALIAFGIKGMVQGKDPTTNAIVDWVKGAFEKVKEWVSMYGGLVLGIILIFSGVGAPFGWALLIDSISSLGKGEKPALWDSILENIKTTWNNIKTYWNENIADVWTLEFWLDLAKIAGNGLIGGFEAAINGIIGMFEKMINWIVDGLNKISFDVPDWVPGIGGKTFGFNIPEVKFGRVSIPRLAQGTVLPGGKPFYAIVNDQPAGQTNIEAPLDTIVDAMNIALQNNGHAVKEEHFYLNERELMSVIYRLAKGGENIKGTSLINGGVY